MIQLIDQPQSVSRSAAHTPPTKVGVLPLFSTWIWQCESGPEHLNERLEELAHRLMLDDRNASLRTNCGGWHYAGDLFSVDEPAVTELHDELAQHVQAFLNHFRPAERKRTDHFRIEGWMNVNRQGDHNILHCHPGSFLSGTYYVHVPPGIAGGEIVFRDPRGPAVAMYETPGIDLPWVGSGMGIPMMPATGHVLMFPSWLEHRVEPFQGAGERISIAFNVSNP